MRQRTHFRCDDGKSLAGIASACSLDPGVQREQIGLEGNAIDHRDDFRFEVCSVRELVVDLVKKYRVSCLAKELSVEVIGDWQLKSDKKWLSFAISQVLDNAIKYSKRGGHIQVQLDEDGIQISDTGMGILPEDLPRLFEEGFTGYNGHEHKKATGLGLYMTKQVLDKLDLVICVHSQVEEGTQVFIYKERERDRNR